MQRLLDPEATKTFEVAGTKFTIKPLRRQDHAKIQILWFDVCGKITNNDESPAATRLTYVKVKAEIDQDKVADIIAKAVVSIDHPKAKDIDAATYLKLIEDDDEFWSIYYEIDNWTGIDEETANFSDSSPEQSSAAAVGENVEKTAATEVDLAGSTQEH